MLTIGQEAPDFTLKTQDGEDVSLSDLRGKQRALLVFYPKDQTPGCTKQLCDIRDNFASLGQYDVVPFGINSDDAASHKEFIDAQNYQFNLLVDEDLKVAREYGATKEQGAGVQRTVYVVGKDGKIILAERGAPSASEVIEVVKSAQDG